MCECVFGGGGEGRGRRRMGLQANQHTGVCGQALPKRVGGGCESVLWRRRVRAMSGVLDACCVGLQRASARHRPPCCCGRVSVVRARFGARVALRLSRMWQPRVRAGCGVGTMWRRVRSHPGGSPLTAWQCQQPGLSGERPAWERFCCCSWLCTTQREELHSFPQVLCHPQTCGICVVGGQVGRRRATANACACRSAAVHGPLRGCPCVHALGAWGRGAVAAPAAVCADAVAKPCALAMRDACGGLCGVGRRLCVCVCARACNTLRSVGWAVCGWPSTAVATHAGMVGGLARSLARHHCEKESTAVTFKHCSCAGPPAAPPTRRSQRLFAPGRKGPGPCARRKGRPCAAASSLAAAGAGAHIACAGSTLIAHCCC
jgi:hypothetical protein